MTTPIGRESVGVGATRRLVMHPRESVLLAVDFRGLLAVGELLTGPLEVTVDPPGPTVEPPSLLPAGVPDPLGGELPPGCGIQFRVSGGTAPTEYRLTCVVRTTQGNTRVAVCRLGLRDE